MEVSDERRKSGNTAMCANSTARTNCLYQRLALVPRIKLRAGLGQVLAQEAAARNNVYGLKCPIMTRK